MITKCHVRVLFAFTLAISIGIANMETVAQTNFNNAITNVKKTNSFQPSVGLNKFDLFLQYLGKSGDTANQKITKAMARKAIVDAKNIGISYMRFAATGYAPASINASGDLDLWVSNPAEYWKRFDTMMYDLNANGIKIVPVFVWNWTQFQCMTGETPTEMIKNQQSKSYLLLTKYIADFISHYKNHPMLYFYELTCELNLYADLTGNFSTDQMIGFTKSLAAYIKSLDPDHPISSGFAAPRPAAQHLRLKPQWSSGGADWTQDSYKDFLKYLGDVHEGLDIVSVHFYNDGDQERFGETGKTNANFLKYCKQATDSLGKLLYVGEYGDVSPYINQDTNALFSQNVLNKIVELKIPFSSPWIWEFYQFDTYTPSSSYNIEPEYTDFIIGKIKNANMKLGNTVPTPQLPDITPPQVILTWPFEGAVLDTLQLINAVASDNNGTISKVELMVDNNVVAAVTRPPYQFKYNTTNLTVGTHEIAATAYDAAGNSARYVARVVTVSHVSAVNEANKSIPNDYLLSQNYPNPFNPSTTISFSIPLKSFVSLIIYDALGREITTLLAKEMAAGTYSTQWSAPGLPSGIYFCRLKAGVFVDTKKLLLMK